MADIAPYSVIVLAAQRTGVVNPLAQRAGVSHKCVVPICGKPLIIHVMDVLAALAVRPHVRVSVEPEIHEELHALFAPYRDAGMTIDFVASSTNIAESVVLAAQGLEAPYLVTTADNVLLTGEAVEQTRALLETADGVLNLAPREAVQAAHPEGQRNYYHFKDVSVANCNLYGISGPKALAATEAFRGGGQFMRNPKRLVDAFGLLNIVLFRFGWLSLASAEKRLSRRFGLAIRAVVQKDGSQAIDVDNERTYDIAELILKQRAGEA